MLKNITVACSLDPFSKTLTQIHLHYNFVDDMHVNIAFCRQITKTTPKKHRKYLHIYFNIEYNFTEKIVGLL